MPKIIKISQVVWKISRLNQFKAIPRLYLRETRDFSQTRNLLENEHLTNLTHISSFFNFAHYIDLK